LLEFSAPSNENPDTLTRFVLPSLFLVLGILCLVLHEVSLHFTIRNISSHISGRSFASLKRISKTRLLYYLVYFTMVIIENYVLTTDRCSEISVFSHRPLQRMFSDTKPSCDNSFAQQWYRHVLAANFPTHYRCIFSAFVASNLSYSNLYLQFSIWYTMAGTKLYLHKNGFRSNTLVFYTSAFMCYKYLLFLIGIRKKNY
jgi:hypothetical protein